MFWNIIFVSIFVFQNNRMTQLTTHYILNRISTIKINVRHIFQMYEHFTVYSLKQKYLNTNIFNYLYIHAQSMLQIVCVDSYLTNFKHFQPIPIGFSQNRSVSARTDRFQPKPTAFSQNRPLSAETDRFQLEPIAFSQNRSLSARTDRFQLEPTAFSRNRSLSARTDRFQPEPIAFSWKQLNITLYY